MDNRIVITGLGAVSPFGVGIDRFAEGMFSGENCIGEITRFAGNEKPAYGCEVRDFAPQEFIPLMEIRKSDAISRYAIAASKLAAMDAGLEYGKELNQRYGVILGTCLGGIDSTEEFHRSLVNDPELSNPSLFPYTVLNQSTGQICLHLKYGGVSSTVSAAQASGQVAIGYAYQLLKEGRADVILAGGAEYLSEIIYTGYNLLNKLSPDPELRPFDTNKSGLLLGEGCGIVVLERMEHALARNARIYAEVMGYSLTHGQGKKAVQAQSRSMEEVLTEAKVAKEDVDFVVASAHSSDFDDLECAAVDQTFGGSPVAISSIKSMIGEGLGAGGAWNVICGVLAMEHQKIPGTIHTQNVLPSDGRRHILKTEESTVNTVLVNSFDPGGTVSSLLLKTWNE